MIELKQVTQVGGDETAGYKVILSKEYTVKSFIEAVIAKNREWGEFQLMNGIIIEYDRNGLKSKISDQDSNKIVLEVFAGGGWGRMDYFIKTGKTQLNKESLTKLGFNPINNEKDCDTLIFNLPESNDQWAIYAEFDNEEVDIYLMDDENNVLKPFNITTIGDIVKLYNLFTHEPLNQTK